VKEDYLFTPLMPDGTRGRMKLSQKDYTHMGRRLGYRGIVTDLLTGKKWHVDGAACSLPSCHCDARVRAVEIAPEVCREQGLRERERERVPTENGRLKAA
jgi:hypothetical protein